MGAMITSDEDYATLERLAIYLEIDWADYLFENPNIPEADRALPYPNPRLDRVPQTFPIEMARLARTWTDDVSLKPKRLCDVGGATGRVIFELERQFPELEQLVLVEPSKRFCEWAGRLLTHDSKLPDMPSIGPAGFPQWVSPQGKPPPVPRADERLSIVNERLERYQTDTGFDLVTCLNVMDRHPCPAEALAEIERLMNPNGLLVMSCPFDFDESTTPNTDAWINDLNVLFGGRSCWSHVGEAEAFYEFRSHARSWTRFSAQVVGKRWLGNVPKHQH